MKDSEQRGENRVPVALRIKLRYRKIDTFVSKFATNISANGMFISSRKPKEMGTLLRFELRLADDSTVIAGQGKVAWVRQFDPAHPKRPHGMGIEFTTLSKGSRALIAQIVARRVEQGLGEADEIPFAAKRRTPPPPLAEAPVAKESAASEAPVPESQAPATPDPATLQAQPTPVPPVAASGVPTQDLEDVETLEIDLRAAVARARALIGSVELDDELDKLYRVSAAPVAETVDEASCDLARMLGGQAVISKRARHIDPPTGVEISAIPPGPDDDEEELEALDSVVAVLAAEAAAGSNSNQRRYARAETDPSPEVIDECDAAEESATRVSEAGLDAVAAIVSETPTAEMARREAPMHLGDDDEESFDLDIDEATPPPLDDFGFSHDEPATEVADLASIQAAARANSDDNDFAEDVDNPVDLTDLIDLPPKLEDAEEIDVDFD